MVKPSTAGYLVRMRTRSGYAAVALALAALLTGCGPAQEAGEQSGPPSGGGSPAVSDPAPASASPSASPTPTSTPVAIPKDCRAILSDEVLAQLKDVPLNDPAFGDSGPQDDGSLVCVWGDPGADTTGLTTEITRMNRGPALDLLNQLAADEGFSCFTPDEGTRCEKTWQNEQYPVTDGRTLFWRDGLLIDTRYSNLAPSGYTSSIIAALWG